MKNIVDMSWIDNLSFETDMDGHKIVTDANKESGGDDTGVRPKKLMLTALGGCTAIDVIMILRKMKVIPEAFNVIVEGELTDQQPKYYRKMKIIYQFKGRDLPKEKLEKAVRLSEEKYCGVSAFYKKVIDIETEIRVINN